MLMEVITEQMEVILWLQIINPQTGPPERKNERERMRAINKKDLLFQYHSVPTIGHVPLLASICL
jgi:hypothetical protein